MSDTPQTDALVVLPSGYTNHIRFNHELVELARTLERELAAVTAERDTASVLAHERGKELAAQGSSSYVEIQKTCGRLETKLAAVTAERDMLKLKNTRLRTELHRLNKTLRSMWDGVRFAQKCNRDMKMRAALRQCREALATCRGGVEAIQAADKVLPP